MKRTTKVFEGWEEEGKQFEKSEGGTWIRDHYHFNKPHTGKMPSKPKDLINIIVKCFTPEGGIVLDPFFGSGVIGDVCTGMNRNYIGFELDKETFNKYKK